MSEGVQEGDEYEFQIVQPAQNPDFGPAQYLCLALGIMLSLFAIYAQATQNTPDELDGALARAKSGDVKCFIK